MKHIDIVISEDVGGASFDQLSREISTLADPTLWADRGRLINALATARALVIRNRTRVDDALLQAAPNLKIIARAGVGLDNIDLLSARQHGVIVVAPRGANAQSVAEYTIGAALALLRGLLTNDHAVRAGQWSRMAGRELSGHMWGVLGVGSTGLAVARLACEFGMTTVGYDPYVDTGHPMVKATGIRLTTLEEVCAASDILSVHLPATAETANLIDRRLLKLMPSHGILINVGRGEVIDEYALIDALTNGGIAGAALDVRRVEPPTLGTLETLDNVLLTPHIAGITEESQARIAKALTDDIRSVLTGGTPKFGVPGPSGAIR